MSDDTRDFHPVANLFPLITGDDFATLTEDIRTNGLLEPIWLHPDGRIIDGRNRYKACRASGVEPTFRTWHGDGSLVEFVVSLNLHRRHLTSSQRAMAALEAESELAKEAEARHRRAAAESNRRRAAQEESLPVDDVPAIQRIEEPDPNARTAVGQAAKLLGTNRQYVSDAKKLTAERPDLAEKVRSGEMSIPEAKKAINAEKVQAKRTEQRDRTASLAAREVPSPDRRYAVIYADPPWRYDFSSTDARAIENQYPTMDVADIAALDVPAATDAVLFMWATNPKLTQAFEVLSGWGFDYVTNMVWVKDRIGMGYYARSRHELLLIAKRGQLSVPEPTDRPDSVIEAPRTRHSAKPELVYGLLERMYPGLPKLEMFCRSPRDGWDAWGNEVAA